MVPLELWTEVTSVTVAQTSLEVAVSCSYRIPSSAYGPLLFLFPPQFNWTRLTTSIRLMADQGTQGNWEEGNFITFSYLKGK